MRAKLLIIPYLLVLIGMIKVVVFDADKTLWDHHNISEFEDPLKLLDENTLEDARGRRLNLFPHVRETLRELKQRGLILAVATWNVEEIAKKVFNTLDLSKYFDVIIARPYPYKFLMISQIIVELDKVGLKVKPNEILFVDDRRGHFGNVWLYLGDVKCLEMWKDIMGYKDILNMITYVNDK